MKSAIFFFCLLTIFQVGSSSWLGDVFNGLTEPLQEESKDIWDTVKDRVTDGVKAFADDHGHITAVVKDKVKEGIKTLKTHGLDDIATETERLLQVAEENGNQLWLEQKLQEKDKALNQWNKLMQKLNDGKKKMNFDHIVKKLRKLHDKLKPLVPKELYNEMVTKAESLLKKVKENFPLSDIKKIKEHVESWTQPAFMKKAAKKLDDLNIKSLIQDAAREINSHIDSAVDQVDPVIKKVTKEVKKEKEEKKIERFVGDFFKKPHTESGTGPWDKTLKTFGKEALTALTGKSAEDILNDDEEDDEDDDADLYNENPNKPETDPMIDTDDNDDDDEDDEMTFEEKEEFKKATQQWEERMKAETDGLLKKLKPADAYIIPNLDDEKTTKDDDKEPAQPIFTGNENWDVYKEYQKDQKKAASAEKQAFFKLQNSKPYKIAADRLENAKFSKDVKYLTSSWMALKRGLTDKMDKLEKKLNKKI